MTPAEILAEHVAGCTGADAAIVVDGNADSVIEALVADGWELTDRVEYVEGKRIRYVRVRTGSAGS